MCNIYSDCYKDLLREIKEEQNKWKDIQYIYIKDTILKNVLSLKL